jgi:hypothetical protein
MNLVPDEPFHPIGVREALGNRLTVLPHPLHQIRRHSHIQSAVTFARKNIYIAYRIPRKESDIISAHELRKLRHRRQFQVQKLKPDLVLAITENTVHGLGPGFNRHQLPVQEKLETQRAGLAGRHRLGMRQADAIAAHIQGAAQDRRGAVEHHQRPRLEHLARRISLIVKHVSSNNWL